MFSRTYVETIRSEPSKRRPLLWLVMHNGATFCNTVAHFMHDLGLIPLTVENFFSWAKYVVIFWLCYKSVNQNHP